MDFEPLLNVLMTGIDQNSWDVVGGAASVKSFPQRAALVVHQTQRTHEKIESLLADLRRHRQDGQPDVAVRPAREEVVPQVYQLTIGDLSEAHQQALRGLIKHSVRPESWGSEGGQERFITFLPGRIIVHNRRDVQAEVVELLLRLGLIVYPGHLGGGVGGGFGGGGGFFAPVPER
jgi:hypothetical protein